MPSLPRKSCSQSISEVLFGHPPETIDMDWMGDPPSPYKNVSCIYFIHLMEPESNSGPFPIPRLIDTDFEGIVEIGMSGDLSNKLRKFKEAVLGTNRNDPEGWKLGYWFSRCKRMREMFRSREYLLGSTRFCIIRMDKRYLRPWESRTIDLSCSRFAEPPPLNGQVPGVTKRNAGKGPGIISRSPELYKKTFDPVRPRTIYLGDPPPYPLHGISCFYQVQLMDPDDPLRTFPIPRVIGTDPDGILATGKTLDLGYKVNNIRYLLKNRKGTGEWALLHHIYGLCPRLEERFGPCREIMDHLAITYYKTRPSLIGSGEIWLTDIYMTRFAELPPMCSQLPGDPRNK